MTGARLDERDEFLSKYGKRIHEVKE